MITISSLTKQYKKNVIFDRLDLNIREGKFTFIVGPNGSGKTTLLKCLLNLEKYQGTIRFGGQPLDDVREQVGVIYDTPALFRHLTGLQNIELLLNRKVTHEEIAEHRELRLAPQLLSSKVKRYSYGQTKKLSLLIACLARPRYLFLDEISNGLDYEALLDLKKMLKANNERMTIIAIGHQFEFYADMIDDLIVLNNGAAQTIQQFQLGGNDLIEAYTTHVTQHCN